MITFNKLHSDFTRIPKASGIYVWGILEPTHDEISKIVNDVSEILKNDGNTIDIKKLLNNEVKDEGRRFLPLNVGEGNNISGRINKHFSNEAFSKAVLFNFTLRIAEFYNGIEGYNYNWLMKPGKTRANVYYPQLQYNVNERFGINSLLFFANPTFLLQVFPTIVLPSGTYITKVNVTQDEIIKSVLPINLGNPAIVNHVHKMIISRIILKKYFRFTYALIPAANLKEFEAATKIALERMGLYTLAHVHGKGITTYKKLRLGEAPMNDVIDFHTYLFGQIYNPLNLPLLNFKV